jgi:ribosomal protein L7/L12
MSEFEIIQLRARVAAIRQGNLIEAIKIYREIYDVGLAEAKAAVEQMRGRL